MSTGKKITSIRKISSPNTKVYDIEVEDAHHYILGDGTVSHNSYVPMKKMGGGSGLDYAASGVVFLSKKKAKDDDKKTTGVILTAKLVKSRLTMEDKRVEVLLDFQKGLDPYYGLSELAESFGIFKKTKIGKSNGFILPDGTEVLERDLDVNPEKYYSKALLDEIDSYCKNEFLYGKTNLVKNEEE